MFAATCPTFQTISTTPSTLSTTPITETTTPITETTTPITQPTTTYTAVPPPIEEDPTNYLPLAAPVEADRVQSLLAYGETVVYDVRSDEAYQKDRIDGALSLALPPILFRRFVKTRLVPGSLDRVGVAPAFAKALEPLATLTAQSLIMVYDESTSHVEDMLPSHPLRIFVEYFAMLGFNVCYVEGGLRAVRRAHPSLVATTPVTASSGHVIIGAPVPLTTTTANNNNNNNNNNNTNSTSASTQPATLCPFTAFETTTRREELNFMDGFLAVGSEAQGHDLELLLSQGVTHVLNVTNTACVPAVAARLETKQITLNDTLSENLLAHLLEALRFIDDVRQAGGKVLVHCFAGVSRSVSICVAYIMWTHGLTAIQAMDFVKAHRECASPNLNFVGQLMMFERTLKGPHSSESLKQICTIAVETLHNALGVVVAN